MPINASAGGPAAEPNVSVLDRASSEAPITHANPQVTYRDGPPRCIDRRCRDAAYVHGHNR